jgi:hypothetical protein
MNMMMTRMTDDDNGYVCGHADDCDDDDDNPPTRCNKHKELILTTLGHKDAKTCGIFRHTEL